jgi:RimJ/RimL family protein N-acetyltransferase
VRQWSFNQDTVVVDEHKAWFNSKVNNAKVLMWIFECENIPAGMVRLEKEGDDVYLNYLIASNSRGGGLASNMLKMAMVEVGDFWKDINVFAYTLPDNIASIKSLERAGFSKHSSTNHKKCYIIRKKKKRIVNSNKNDQI